VDFANTGPLQDILKPILADSTVDGPARLEVELTTPLSRPDSSTGPWPVSVDGNVFLQKSNIQLAAVDLPLENVRGPIGFNEAGIELKTLQATLFGSPVRLNAASTGEGDKRRTDIAVRGLMPARPILERYEIPGSEYVAGNSNWRADASVPHDPTRLANEGIALTITSDLVGTALTRFGAPEAIVNDVRVAVSSEGMEGLIMSLGASLGDKQPTEGIRVEGSTNVLSLDGF